MSQPSVAASIRRQAKGSRRMIGECQFKSKGESDAGRDQNRLAEVEGTTKPSWGSSDLPLCPLC